MKNNNKKLRIDFFTGTIAFLLSYLICSHATEMRYKKIAPNEQKDTTQELKKA